MLAFAFVKLPVRCKIALEIDRHSQMLSWQPSDDITEMMQTKYGYYRQLVGVPSSAIYMTFGVTLRVAKPFKCNFLWQPFCLTAAAAMRSV